MSDYTTDDAINILYRCGIRTLPTMLKLLRKGDFNISERNLARKIQILNEKSEVHDKRKGASGRPSVLTKQDKSRIVTLLEREPFLNTAEIKASLKLSCGVRKIGRFLKQEGYKYLRVAKVPRLTVDDKENRLQFAKRHKIDDWTQTFFLDESTFRVGSHRNKAYQRSNKRLSIPINKVPAKINVIGMISSRGGSRLICFQENLDAKLFVTFLKDLKKDAETLYRRKKYRLCMDKDPKHTSQAAKTYMQEAKINWLEDWPPRSPDLNPIENIWGLMEQELKKLHITNSYHLKQALKGIWNRITSQKRLEKLMDSMADRMKEVVAKKGDKINY
jgi:transposase